MATKKYYIGSEGPFLFDDTDLINDPDGDFVGMTRQAFVTGSTMTADNLSVDGAWPVGSVFLSIISTDPATLLGIGIWTRIAEGQFLAGYKAADADFGTLGGTGGLRKHKHTVDPPATNSGGPGAIVSVDNNADASVVDIGSKIHTHSTNISAFNSSEVDHLPPYLTVYIWKRVS